MTLETFINQFGYIALILGLIAEGETILVLAAFLAHRGHLELPWVILISILVEVLSAQYFFWQGFTKGKRFLETRPIWEQRIRKANTLFGRNTNLLFLTFQFMYGFRIIIPFVCGMNRLDYKKFSLFNLAGVVLWAVLYGTTGYLFGQVVEVLLEDVEKYEFWIILFFIMIGGIIWVYRNRDQKLIVKAESNE